MPPTPQQIFEGYLHAGTVSRDADALAETFTEDGVFEAPLMPDGAAFPRRLAGREEIRTAMAAYYARPVEGGRAPNFEKSGYVLHTTSDPDVFIAEIDTVFDGDGDGEGADGEGTADRAVSLVQIFRVRDGKIARLRDYFAPALVD
ncbi:nuclear transport factor 2 family protein [Streptomyces sp. WAC07061]|uniref:nuclear transport factor 2 family protein n=1 Tax=Streptomyces sp. WAC07061 TaxID=2487410 RepID=UPI000F777ADF|nr:nuclear transport factor 2 family protein [Streptomyces sp. WAC07061]RSS62164.1 nuclear transport factor 2 family protein [Streptomyces sp. WAC07061]